mgnify:FL=1
MPTPAPSARPYLRVAVIFALATAVVAWVSGWLQFPALPAEVKPSTAMDFSASQVARNARYRAELGQWPLIELFAPAAVAVLIAITGLRSRIVRRVRRVTWLSVSGHAGLVVAAMVTLMRLAALPAVWAGEVVARRWSLSTQSTPSWLREQLLGLLTAAFIAFVVAGVATAAVRRWPRTWALRLSWLAAAAVLLLTLFPIMRALPPEKTAPLPNSAVSTAMRDMATKAGLAGTHLRVLNVSEDSAEINAYASGSGPMAQVVVYDTLLKGVPTPQVLSVLAHELGHVRYRDSLVLSVATAACVGSGVLGLGLFWRRRKLAATRLPFALTEIPGVCAAVAVVMLLLLPASNAVSRAVEARADIYSLETTNDPVAFVRVMRTIAVHGHSYLGDQTPWGWARSHPTIAWRLALARAWAKERGIVVPATSPDNTAQRPR